MYECLKQEQENPTGSVTPFAAEEALGKIIAFQLKDKGMYSGNAETQLA